MTETLVGGVLAAVLALATRQSLLGHDVTVIYPRKPAVPVAAELDARFPSDVRRVELTYRGRVATLRDLRVAIRGADRDMDVLHLHSTFAGIAGRLPFVRVPDGCVVAYSPHGFAFLRESSSAVSNLAALALERVLKPRCDGLILVSPSEEAVARTRLGESHCDVLQNGIPVDGLPRAHGSGNPRPVVVASGRLGEQKGPDRFAEVARALGDRADFVWIGDGPREGRERWMGDAPVRLTGWLSHEDVIAQLAASDIFLFPTRWEGMPISLMEAQVMGLPAVATDIVGNRDVVLSGETGYLCSDVPDLIAAVSSLVDDPLERSRMSARALEVQRDRLSDIDLGTASIQVYDRMAARVSDPMSS
ncbi:glycosyltransferase [Micromonospora sp. DT81.3]|uniref:glycosyltransferase n=1 Tax=Micromonospora sp. DT81.3 TaxID=3416523 RepID=UPI003CF4E1B1